MAESVKHGHVCRTTEGKGQKGTQSRKKSFSTATVATARSHCVSSTDVGQAAEPAQSEGKKRLTYIIHSTASG